VELSTLLANATVITGGILAMTEANSLWNFHGWRTFPPILTHTVKILSITLSPSPFYIFKLYFIL